MRMPIILCTFCIIVSVSGCSSITASAPAGQRVATADVLAPLPNLLILAAGRVEVRRKDSQKPVLVTLGTELAPGDVVTVIQGSAAIFCGAEANWDTNPLPLTVAKASGVPCGDGRPPRPYPDVAGVRARGGDVPTMSNEIYILSPRSGWVLNDRPALVWHEIAGATSYTVTLEGDDGLVRTTVADSSPLSYPDAWEPLQAEGASYRLILQTADKTSDPQAPGFSLLEDQTAFLDRVEHLRQRIAEEPTRTLLLAELYLSHSLPGQSFALRSEAVDLLTALPDADQIIAVQNLLGETYLAMGLVAQGQAAYTRMAELAEAQGFLESQAQALTGLGWAACALRDLDAVAEYWSQAHALYNQYGLKTQTEAIQTLLAETEKHCKVN